MNIKELYRRFRAWQIAPTLDWDKGAGVHCCPNCGNEFNGNYCPHCGQKAGDGRITWRWVGKSILAVWGMDSRSLPHTILHLILRPGYLIGDYINGRRQACYNPVNMLFIVGLFYAIIMQLLGHETEESHYSDNVIFNAIVNWLEGHPAWFTMSLTMIMVLPTYLLFRFAPRHTRHTLPESFFIQLFMNTLMLLCVLCSNVNNKLDLLIPFYYYISYRQLFGYRPWGTLWRLLLSGIIWCLLVLTIATPMFFSYTDAENVLGNLVVLTLFSAFVALLLAIGYWIGKKTAQGRNADTQKKHTLSHQK